jgi:hypothetical protein
MVVAVAKPAESDVLVCVCMNVRVTAVLCSTSAFQIAHGLFISYRNTVENKLKI